MTWKSTPGLRTTVLTCKFSTLHCLQDPEVYNHQTPSLGYHKCKHSKYPVIQQTTECDGDKLVTSFNKAAYYKLLAVLWLAKIPHTRWVTVSQPHHQWEKHTELSCLPVFSKGSVHSKDRIQVVGIFFGPEHMKFLQLPIYILPFICVVFTEKATYSCSRIKSLRLTLSSLNRIWPSSSLTISQ